MRALPPSPRLMAARRLLIVMLVLLGLSTLAAALVPPRTTDEGTTSTATEQTPLVPADTTPHGALQRFAITVARGRISVLPAYAGDQLQLAICSAKPDQVEIPAFGLVDPVGMNKPAQFDLVVESPGSYGVRLVNTDRVVARIQVGPAADKQGLGTADVGRLTGRDRRCAEFAGFL